MQVGYHFSLEVISSDKFTPLKCPFQIPFDIVLLVLVGHEMKENKASYGWKKEMVPVGECFGDPARVGHVVIIVMIYRSEITTWWPMG